MLDSAGLHNNVQREARQATESELCISSLAEERKRLREAGKHEEASRGQVRINTNRSGTIGLSDLPKSP